MQQDAVQHLAEIEATDDDDAEEEKEDIPAPATREISPRESSSMEVSGSQQSSESALNDDDARCYSARYQDIDALLDPKAHFSSTGLQ